MGRRYPQDVAQRLPAAHHTGPEDNAAPKRSRKLTRLGTAAPDVPYLFLASAVTAKALASLTRMPILG